MLHISTVFVSKPEHISYAEAMSRMRMWLDFRKIETSSFKLAPEGREGFEITFGTNSHAVLFQSESTWPPPQALQVPAASVLRLATSAPLCRQPTKPAEASGAKVRFGGTVRARSVVPGWQRIVRKPIRSRSVGAWGTARCRTMPSNARLHHGGLGIACCRADGDTGPVDGAPSGPGSRADPPVIRWMRAGYQALLRRLADRPHTLAPE
jgi:hypothetical protein